VTALGTYVVTDKGGYTNYIAVTFEYVDGRTIDILDFELDRFGTKTPHGTEFTAYAHRLGIERVKKFCEIDAAEEAERLDDADRFPALCR
jgi:hypothetical protein